MSKKKRAKGGRAPILALTLALALTAPVRSAAAGAIYCYRDQAGVLHVSNHKLNSQYKTLYVFPESGGAARAAGPAARTGLDREDILRIVGDVSPRHGLDPSLVRAVIEVESGYSVNAVSPKGAQGLMQIMPATQRDLGLSAPFDPRGNIEAGARYLRQLLDKFDHSLHLALAAYNAGPAQVERHGGVPPIPETINYVLAVLERYQRYRVAFR